MKHFKVAMTRLGGVDLLLVPVDNMESRPDREQQIIMDELQNRASMAGLVGLVIPVWRDAGSANGMKFRAPDTLHPLLQALNMDWVLSNLNKVVRWDGRR
ncbi:MAG: hypothetical protein AB7P07_13810 [Hyphomonadaceae bacterium]